MILGSATGEAFGSAPADIRAFDVVTGLLAWVFHTIPHPGEPGHETWAQDAWTYIGGAANWGEMSVDEKRGIAYIPTGAAKNEFWGGDRLGNALSRTASWRSKPAPGSGVVLPDDSPRCVGIRKGGGTDSLTDAQNGRTVGYGRAGEQERLPGRAGS